MENTEEEIGTLADEAKPIAKMPLSAFETPSDWSCDELEQILQARGKGRTWKHQALRRLVWELMCDRAAWQSTAEALENGINGYFEEQAGASSIPESSGLVAVDGTSIPSAAQFREEE